MILSDFFRHVNSAYRGTDDDAPASGTPDYTEWLDATNRKKNQWAKDMKVLWRSCWELRDIGTVTAGTQAYELDDDFIAPSDKLAVTTLTQQEVDYTIVAPEERRSVPRSVYISGRDPQVLTFADPITSTDHIVGGTMQLGGFFLPDDLENPKDVIPVDDPYWLVYAVAAELAFNDLTYEDKAPDLEGNADKLWAVMVANNRRGTSGNPRTARTHVARIPGTNR
jgi:hypothetical protein